MPERQFLSNSEKRKKRLIALGVVLVLVIICFAARHFVGDWLRNKNLSPKKDMIVTTTDAMNVKDQLTKLSPHDLRKFGKAMRSKVAEEIALANNVPPDPPSQSAQVNGESSSDSSLASPTSQQNTVVKSDEAMQQTRQSSESAAHALPPEKTPMQNAMDTLLKRLELEAFSIPVAGRRLIVFRYHYPAVQVDTISHGVVIYGYSGETLKRIACYYRYPVSLTHGACADEIEKVFHVRI